MRRKRSTFSRVDRVGALMRGEVERIVAFELTSPLARHVQVTDVKLSGDLGHLRIRYVLRPFDDDDETPPEAPTEESLDRAQRMLDRSSGYVARVLIDTLQLRKPPQVVFSFDREYERMRRVQRVLDATRPVARAETSRDGEA